MSFLGTRLIVASGQRTGNSADSQRDHKEEDVQISGHGAGDEVYARHHAMMDMILKNREAQLMKMAELRRKLDAAEKVETCRRIRTGQSPESFRRTKPSRSMSRGAAHLYKL